MLVSVLISSYNTGKYIDYCIQSVLSQTYNDVETIVYDDGSDDNSLDIIRSFGDKITLIAEKHYGLGHSFNQVNAINRAFEVSQGTILCLLDGDDAFLPTKVQKVVAEFLKDELIIMVQHKLQDIDKDHLPIRLHRNEPFLKSDYLKAIYFTQRLDKYFMPTSGLAFRRRYLEEVLPIAIDQHDMVSLDVRLNREAMFYGGIRTLNETLGQYRVHGASYTATTINRDNLNRKVQQIYDYFNVIASKHGYPSLKYSPRLWWKVVSNLRLFLYIIVCKERISRKWRLFWNLAIRLALRRSILRSFGLE